jgi:hypothetical protein
MKVKWSIKPPCFTARPCLVTIKRKNKSRYITEGWAGFGEIMHGAIAYAEYPDFEKSKEGWKSDYTGDENPNKSGLYLVTFMERNEISFPPKICWYNSRKDTFGDSLDAIAWTELPEPYME